MAARAKSSARRRGWRQRIDLGRAVIVGNSSDPRIVYGYRFPSHPRRIKIGYSSRGLVRVAEQSTAFPEKPVVEFVIHHPRARAIEAAFHAALRGSQSDVIGTEWFDASREEVMAASPLLRRATGRSRIARRLRIGLSILLAVCGLCLVPAIAAVMAAVLSGADAAAVIAQAGTYLAGLPSLPLRTTLDRAEDLLRWAGSRDMPPVLFLVAALPVPALALVPFIRRRRQAF